MDPYLWMATAAYAPNLVGINSVYSYEKAV